MGARFSQTARAEDRAANSDSSCDDSVPAADHSMLPEIDRETTPLSVKQDVLEMTFMLETMRMKQWIADDENRRAILERVDNSGHEYDPATFEPAPLPVDADGFVRSFDVAERDAIRAFFAQHGLVVVRDVIDAAACSRSIDELWEGLEARFPGLRRGDASTYERWPALAQLGILGNTFVLSPQFTANRQAPRLHRAFAHLFG